MKSSHPIKMLALAASVAATLVPLQAGADDIDIFTGAGAGKNGNARILIVLDNQAHWTSQSQQWPGGISQGQAELRAIKRLVNAIPDGSIDMGLMIFNSGPSIGNTDGAYVRQRVATISTAIDPLTNKSTKAEFSAKLDNIFDNIGSNAEKRSSSARYGNLIYDAYSYWAGGVPIYKDQVPTALADPYAYTTPYSKYKSPITDTNQCGKNYIIFIGNPASDGVQDDTPGNDGDTMVPDNLKKEADVRNSAGVLINPTPLPLPNITEDVKQTTVTQVGETTACYSTALLAKVEIASRTDLTDDCKTYTQGCSIGAQLPAGGMSCPANTYQWAINGTNIYITNVVSTGTVEDNIDSYLDDFALLMAGKGVKLADSTSTPPARVPVSTFTIDVYNAQSNHEHTQVLLSTANAGNGGYFKAGNEEEIYKALAQILAQIQATDTAFASTSLPVNATNRAQNANAVFIGMFRPDEKARPRWFGNLKRYKLISNNGEIALGDFNGKAAINPKGFMKPCAVSYWTTDTPWTYKYGTITLETGYWDQMGLSPKPEGNCPETDIPGNRPYSDYPDGSFVEKGAAAEVLRLGNSSLVAGADWQKATLNRNMVTLDSSNAIVPFDAEHTKLNADLVDFTRGIDVNDERNREVLRAERPTTPRPSIHGDVIHSRPLPVNYATTGDEAEAVTIYYGANDGALHAVDAKTGVEKWSFVAPEFYDKLTRLKSNSPLVSYPDDKGNIADGTLPRAYYFDGSTGLFQNADNSSVVIYPTMRRGGRMIYGLDVKDRANPKFLWRTGCPNLDNDDFCKEGQGAAVNEDVKSIGQTWSTPNVAFIKGYSKPKTPVLLVGGGYDICQDKNMADPDCTGKKGGFIYAIDGLSGMVLQTFKTDLGVIADVAYVDVNNDNKPDYAYALDLGGNVYRIDFVIGADASTALVEGKWKFRKVAYTRGGGRKFMYAPALLGAKDKVYLAAGTGDREHPLEIQYPFKNVKNRFYVYKDDLTVPDTTDPVNLDTMLDYTSKNDCDTPPVLPKSELVGWFMDLAQGEQVVTSGVIVSGMVTFSTNRPTPAATGTCTNSLGEARGYWVNLFNASGAVNTTKSCGGDRSSIFNTGGLPPSPVLVPSVLVDGKPVSVIIGAAAKTAGRADAGSAMAPREVKMTISKERKRTYTYSKGE